MEQRIIQLTEEIYKRKQDMVEMSRKIIVLDRELKASHRQRGSYEFDRSSGSSCSGSRPFSQISYESCQSEKTLRTTTKWFKMSPLRYGFGHSIQVNQRLNIFLKSNVSNLQA